ncbi:MAG: (2Fe-2S) ferredoxin domain-containing protein [Kaiparowitsia implicata GSE-PSE-MK54-09C]|jgi:(2Fe-2S) ferredoxin|nr:(2Fe-2S) ferredoxin domain-containing protein [Kaiparowitsia implicata GSE-PSE-MK54-09C]
MGKSYSTKTSFQLEGRLLELVVKDGYKIKGLRLATATGEHYIKLTKEVRASCRQTLTPGDWVYVRGQQTVEMDGTITKLKALVLNKGTLDLTTTAALPLPMMAVASAPSQSTAASPAKPAPAQKACILVCQKSDCCKRGGSAVVAALQQELSDRQLDHHVTIKGTGCMKRCKAGPNVVMPDKTRYTRIRPDDITQVVDRHFPTSTASAI